MAKTSVNATVKSNQQKISKVLYSQLVSGMRELARYSDNEASMKRALEYRISTSRAHKAGCIGGWNARDFAFDFEYGRNNSVRISYMNSDGMISAVFSERQWLMLSGFIQGKLDRIIDSRLLDIEIQKREEEEELFQRRVNHAVEIALLQRCSEPAKCNCKCESSEMSK